MQVDNIDQTMPVPRGVISKLKEYQEYIYSPKQDALSILSKDINEENASTTWTTQIEQVHIGGFLPGSLVTATDVSSMASSALLSIGNSISIVFPQILNNLALYSAIVTAEHSEATRGLIIPSIPALNEMRAYSNASFSEIQNFTAAGIYGTHNRNVWEEGAAAARASGETLSVPAEARLFLYPELVAFAEGLVEVIEGLAPSANVQISKFKWSVFKGVEEDTRELVLHVVIEEGSDAAFNFWDKIGDAITEKSKAFSSEMHDQLLRHLSIDVSWT